MPMYWVVDGTRSKQQAVQYADKDEAAESLVKGYRRDLWQSQERQVEVWCESDSIAGTLASKVHEYGLGLMPARGQSGKRFVWDSSQSFGETGKPVTVIYVGDFDPAGLTIGDSVKERLTRYLPYRSEVEIDFELLAIQAEQVRDMGLAGHGLGSKYQNDTWIKKLREWRTICDDTGIGWEAVESESMPAPDLRDMLGAAIEVHIDQEAWDREKAAEAEERQQLSEALGIDIDPDDPETEDEVW